MNILLWVLQVLLALHTIIGAVWKFSNPAQVIPSLQVIPSRAWMAMSVVEILCSVGLLLPIVFKPASSLAPASAALIAVEMLAFCAVHLMSGDTNHGPMVYWIVVAVICSFIAYGRSVLTPI